MLLFRKRVVDIYKQSYNSHKSDVVKLYKARKKTDYAKVGYFDFQINGRSF